MRVARPIVLISLDCLGTSASTCNTPVIPEMLMRTLVLFSRRISSEVCLKEERERMFVPVLRTCLRLLIGLSYRPAYRLLNNDRCEETVPAGI